MKKPQLFLVSSKQDLKINNLLAKHNVTAILTFSLLSSNNAQIFSTHPYLII